MYYKLFSQKYMQSIVSQKSLHRFIYVFITGMVENESKKLKINILKVLKDIMPHLLKFHLLYAHPEAVKKADLVPKAAPANDFRDCFDFQDNFPDGRIGSDSSLASIDIGKELLKGPVQDVLEVYQSFYK